MFSSNLAGNPGLDLLMQQQLLLHLMEQERVIEKTKPVIRGVSWLREPPERLEPGRQAASPKVDVWTCPRCRSHRCMRVNPGNVDDPVKLPGAVEHGRARYEVGSSQGLALDLCAGLRSRCSCRPAWAVFHRSICAMANLIAASAHQPVQGLASCGEEGMVGRQKAVVGV